MEKISAIQSNLKKGISNGKNAFLIQIIIVVLIITGVAISVQGFLTINNILNIIVQSTTLGVMAIGVAFVMITGGIDLSIPAIMAVSSVIGASVMVRTGSSILGCMVILGVALGFGLINGLAVSKLKLVPMVVTLASMIVAGGLAIWYTQAQSITGLPQGFIDVVSGKIGIVPVQVVVFIIFGFITHLILSKTLFGRWVYSVGINAKTAKVSGIPTTFTITSVYVVSGIFAGVAGILLTARLAAASSGMGPDTLVLDVISSAVIGGVSIYGGVGTVLGTAFGAVFITIINNVMNLQGVPFYFTLIIKGIIIVIATIVNGLKARKFVS